MINLRRQMVCLKKEQFKKLSLETQHLDGIFYFF